MKKKIFITILTLTFAGILVFSGYQIYKCFSKLAMAYCFILDVLQLILLGCIGHQSSWKDGVAVHRCWT